MVCVDFVSLSSFFTCVFWHNCNFMTGIMLVINCREITCEPIPYAHARDRNRDKKQTPERHSFLLSQKAKNIHYY